MAEQKIRTRRSRKLHGMDAAENPHPTRRHGWSQVGAGGSSRPTKSRGARETLGHTLEAERARRARVGRREENAPYGNTRGLEQRGWARHQGGDATKEMGAMGARAGDQRTPARERNGNGLGAERQEEEEAAHMILILRVKRRGDRLCRIFSFFLDF
jgi:hypothetical protein